jgi:hypothetical protein
MDRALVCADFPGERTLASIRSHHARCARAKPALREHPRIAAGVVPAADIAAIAAPLPRQNLRDR